MKTNPGPKGAVAAPSQCEDVPSRPAPLPLLPWDCGKHCTSGTPRRNRPPHLEMGKRSPREAGDPSEDTQLVGASTGSQRGLAALLTLASPPVLADSQVHKKGSCLAVSAPGLPARRRRASGRASAADGVRSQRGVSMGALEGEVPLAKDPDHSTVFI